MVDLKILWSVLLISVSIKKVSTYTGFEGLVALGVKINVPLEYDAILFDWHDKSVSYIDKTDYQGQL